MARVVLILPSGTYRAEDFVGGASDAGIDLIVASDQRQALSAAMGERALFVDLCDPALAARSIVAMARRHPIDAVLAVDDQGVEAAALAAAELGLPHSPPEAVAATRDKVRMRQLLQAGGVRQPDFAAVGPDDDIVERAGAIGFPGVIKPVSLSASRGVIRVDDPDGAGRAAARVRAILEDAGRDPRETLLIERYVAGREVAVEALLEDGCLSPLVVFDKPDPLEGPYFEETIYVTPSRLSDLDLASVQTVLHEAVRAIGLTHGVIHGELRVEQGSAVMFEVAARSIGGLCSRAVHFATGWSLEELILRQAVGLPVADGTKAAAGASGVMMLPIARTGRLVDVRGLEAARRVPLVSGVEITIPRGGKVVALPEGDRYLGFAFAAGPDPEAVEAALRTAHDHLEFEIGDETDR